MNDRKLDEVSLRVVSRNSPIDFLDFSESSSFSGAGNVLNQSSNLLLRYDGTDSIAEKIVICAKVEF